MGGLFDVFFFEFLDQGGLDCGAAGGKVGWVNGGGGGGGSEDYGCGGEERLEDAGDFGGV